MTGEHLSHFEIEYNNIYSEVTKLCENTLPSFQPMMRLGKNAFYMFCFLLGTSPKV